MFSQLGPLFKTTFRQAESNDTRQHIPHDERDKGRRKREEAEKENTATDPWVDDTSVTVEALHTFLINFLKTMPGADDGLTDTEKEDQKPITNRPPEKKRPTNTHNAKAVRAYQSMADKVSDTKPPLPPQNTSSGQEPTADLLQSQELRDIHRLIDDLDKLAGNGVQALHIRPAASFVESLKDAVKLALSKI